MSANNTVFHYPLYHPFNPYRTIINNSRRPYTPRLKPDTTCKSYAELLDKNVEYKEYLKSKEAERIRQEQQNQSLLWAAIIVIPILILLGYRLSK